MSLAITRTNRANPTLRITTIFLSKLKSLGKLPQRVIMHIIVVVGVYTNIQHSKGLTFVRRFLELMNNK